MSSSFPWPSFIRETRELHARQQQRDLDRARRRQALRDKAAAIGREIEREKRRPLGRYRLTPKQKQAIRERVLSGMRPLKGSNIWSGV